MGVFCGDGIGFFGMDGGIPRSSGINVAKNAKIAYNILVMDFRTSNRG